MIISLGIEIKAQSGERNTSKSSWILSLDEAQQIRGAQTNECGQCLTRVKDVCINNCQYIRRYYFAYCDEEQPCDGSCTGNCPTTSSHSLKSWVDLNGSWLSCGYSGSTINNYCNDRSIENLNFDNCYLTTGYTGTSSTNALVCDI